MIKGTKKSSGRTEEQVEAEGVPMDVEGVSVAPPPESGGLDVARQIGQVLRQAREARGGTLEEASRQTRIRVVHLQAIEAGDIGALPGPAFVIGFLRLYVKYLNVSERETVDRFAKQWHQGDGFLATQFFPPPPNTSRSRPSFWMVTLGILGLVALVAWYARSSPGLPLFGNGHGVGIKAVVARAAVDKPVAGDAAPDTVDPDADADEGAMAPISSPFADSFDVQGGEEEEEGVQQERQDQDEEGFPDSRFAAKAGDLPAKPGARVPERGRGEGVAANRPAMQGSVAQGVEVRPGGEPKRVEVSGPVVGTRHEAGNPPVVGTRPDAGNPPAVVSRPDKAPGVVAGAGGIAEGREGQGVQKPLEGSRTAGEVGQRPVRADASPDRALPEGARGAAPPGERVSGAPGSSAAHTSGAPVAGSPDVSVTSGTSDAPVAGSPDVSVSAATKVSPDSSGSRVTLVATEEAWVAVQREDGRQIKNRVMKPGERFEVPVGGRYTAQLGNAGGVQVLVDGHPLPPLGRRGGIVRQLDLSAESLLDRFRQAAPE
ncbi:MAG: DUF4115 domain-containing protein [Magnetococcales bacterium]|nr:DUF4115 domain-containing protein [Magnetococcales bacterium]